MKNPFLHLSSNYFSMVTPFFSLTNLTELNLSGNPIPPDQLDRLRNALPNCKIIYD
jgi:Leucine-rich repeat (LRR) protein